MKKTPTGSSVGVDDPYAHVDRCDHLTDDGRCRYAAEYGRHDPAFAADLRADDFRCPVVHGAEGGAEADYPWADCEHFRSTTDGKTCARCGIDERPDPEGRPLLEEHHLAYPDGETGHEITVALCRWCHAKVHGSWARIDEDAAPDPAALAEREGGRSDELAEGFESAADRYDRPE